MKRQYTVIINNNNQRIMSVFRSDHKSQNINASESLSDKSRSLISCMKCSRNKILIQSLTQQCWSLQKSFMIKELQYNQLKNQMSSLKQGEDQSFTEVTSRLLIEKEQRIKLLQKQLQQSKAFNSFQKKQLQQKNFLLKSFEEKYKNNLLTLRQQMEEIFQASSEKFQLLMNEIEQKEEENLFFRQKCAQLQNLLEKTSLSETKKANYCSQPNKNMEKIELNIPQQPQTNNCYKPSSKALQKLLSNKFVGQPIKLSQNLQSTRSNKTLPNGGIGFKSERNLLINNTYHPVREQKRRQMTFGITMAGISSQKMFKKQKCHTEDSLESILIKLGDIQNEVRKQINSSKRGYK